MTHNESNLFKDHVLIIEFKFIKKQVTVSLNKSTDFQVHPKSECGSEHVLDVIEFAKLNFIEEKRFSQSYKI